MSGRKLAAVAAAMLLVHASDAHAQKYSWDFGVNGGYSMMTPSLTEQDVGSAGEDVKFEPGALAGAQLTWWAMPRFGFLPGARLGLRANAAYGFRDLEQAVESGTNNTLVWGNNLWSGTGDLMFGFNSPRDTWSGFEFLPYLALGAGAKWINPAGDAYTATDPTEGKSWNGVPFTCVTSTGVCSGPGSVATFTGRNGFFLGEEHVFQALAGLGADLRFTPNFALRLEVGDRIWKAPIHQIGSNTTLGTFPGTATLVDDSRIGKTINELYAQAGLHMLFGLKAPPAVAVVAPAPPPAAPPVTPPPAPREESVRVCVIDPTNEMGLRTVDAVFLPSTGDTLVTVNGSRVKLNTTTGNVMVASNAQWFVQGQPLTLKVGNENAGFVTYGTSRIVSGEDLAYLGTVNGVPVYADRDDVKDVEEDLRELRRAQNRADLDDILDEHSDIRGDLKDIKVLYVPLQPTGCVFQPLQRQEQVRKVRG